MPVFTSTRTSISVACLTERNGKRANEGLKIPTAQEGPQEIAQRSAAEPSQYEMPGRTKATTIEAERDQEASTGSRTLKATRSRPSIVYALPP
jgi:hypothetical protein